MAQPVLRVRFARGPESGERCDHVGFGNPSGQTRLPDRSALHTDICRWSGVPEHLVLGRRTPARNPRLSQRLALSRIACFLCPGRCGTRSYLPHSRLLTMDASRFLFVLLLCAGITGCGARIIKDENALTVYRLADGSLCGPPAGFDELAGRPGTLQVRSLFLSSAPPEAVAASISDLPPDQELDAALYLSCGEYVQGEMSKEVFARQRRIYQALRLEHMTRGIQRWREDPDGFAMPGKLCYFIFNNDGPDIRNVTRRVPDLTSIDDCALYVFNNGGTHVLLGCTDGRWLSRWAAQPLRAGPNGQLNRRLSPAGTRYAPEPNCGWG